MSQYSFHELAATQLDLQAQDQHRVGSLGGEREKAGVLERATGKSAWPTEALSEVRAPILVCHFAMCLSAVAEHLAHCSVQRTIESSLPIAL